MVDLDWKSKLVTPDMSAKAPKISTATTAAANIHRSTPSLVAAAVPGLRLASPSHASASAYEHYLRLPELRRLWTSKNFPSWPSETLLKPLLQSLEITFRLISVALSDPRPYSNRLLRESRLESLAIHQIELIAALASDPSALSGAPSADADADSNGVLDRGDRTSSEVWTVSGIDGDSTPHSVVRRSSAESLLPRLAAWRRAEPLARRIALAIECHLSRAPVSLGLGEPNLAGKPNLDYDLVVRPSELHALKTPPKKIENHESAALYHTLQILESWIFAGQRLLDRISDQIQTRDFGGAASDCWVLERIWRLLLEIEDLHLLMDPDDFLRLKSDLCIRSAVGSDPICFRSAALVELTRSSRDLRRRVPEILGVEVDRRGGPRVQEAAMRALHQKSEPAQIHLLQGFQAVEGAMKGFFYGYWQVVVAVMGSLEATGNRGFVVVGPEEELDPLAQMFLDPPYYPSLDAAKTFLGEFWQARDRAHK